MALNIKNPEVERLAAEVAILTGETKTEAIRKALAERKQRLGLRKPRTGRDELLETLRRDVWSQIPDEFRGKGIAYLPVDDILEFGPGDCLSYATAKLAKQSLLYIGNDFAQTDLG